MNHVFSGWSQANYKPEASLEPDLILYAECMNRIFRLTKQLAEEFGLVDYQYDLGKLYMEEPGFSDCADQYAFVWKKDTSKAAHWFEKAANQGHAKAMEALGAILFHDHPEQAKLWYTRQTPGIFFNRQRQKHSSCSPLSAISTNRNERHHRCIFAVTSARRDRPLSDYGITLS